MFENIFFFFLSRRRSLIVMCVGANSPGFCFVFSVRIDQIHYWFHYQDTNDIISSSFKEIMTLHQKVLTYQYIMPHFLIAICQCRELALSHPNSTNQLSPLSLATFPVNTLQTVLRFPTLSPLFCMMEYLFFFYPFLPWDTYHYVFSDFRIFKR